MMNKLGFMKNMKGYKIGAVVLVEFIEESDGNGSFLRELDN